MTDREAMKMALAKLEHLWEIGIDAEFKVELMPEIAALRQALAQPEQEKESAPQNADPRLLLVRKDNCTALAQPEQEPQLSDAGADTSITRGLEPKGSGMVTLHQPVAWMMPDYGDVLSASEADGTGIYNIPLYTAPPKPEPKSISTNDHLCAMLRQVHDVLACTALPMKRKWVGLTDDEIEDTWGNTPMMLNARDGGARRVFARAIEAKLKEKNT
jgi:hypothetical protein